MTKKVNVTNKCIMLLCANAAEDRYDGHCYKHVDDYLDHLASNLAEKIGKDEVYLLLKLLDLRERLFVDREIGR